MATPVVLIAGDGIGPEVMREAIKVLRAIEKKFSLTLKITEAPVGWAGIDAAGSCAGTGPGRVTPPPTGPGGGSLGRAVTVASSRRWGVPTKS